MTILGKDKFKSFIGGFWTIILVLGIFIYGAFQTNMMFNYGDTNISIKSVLKDRTTDREINTPFPSLQLSFIVEKDGVNLYEEGGYIDITVNQVKQIYEYNPTSGIKERQRTKTSLDFEKCGSNFYLENQEILDNLNIKNYYCFKDNYFTIGGSYYSPIFHYLEIRMSTCINGTSSVT